MKWLVINTDYPEFLEWLYAKHPGLKQRTYDEQLQVRNESLFGVADYYSSNLHKLGHEAHDIHVNNVAMQAAWAKEQGLDIPATSQSTLFQKKVGSLLKSCVNHTPLRYAKKWVKTRISRPFERSWMADMLEAQIRHWSPDVVLNQDMELITPDFLNRIKPRIRCLIGQHAARSLPGNFDWRCYDLVVSSYPATVAIASEAGTLAYLNRMGFEEGLLNELPAEPTAKKYDLVFIGSFADVHESRILFLEAIARAFPQLCVWAPSLDGLSRRSVLRRCYQGQAWGKEMYRIFRSSRIVINHHGSIGPYANNMRLFEVTGMGVLLLTDWKANLRELFEPGKEVATYRSPEECLGHIRYYLEHDEERQAVARAGQARTLQEHTYFRRMQELTEIVDKHPSVRAAGVLARKA